MSGDAMEWTAELAIRVDDVRVASALLKVLRPESAREVPRARVHVTTDGPGRLRLNLSARDVGAMRAALNTYLGWVDLAMGTARASGAY